MARVEKALIDKQLDEIAVIIGKHPDGISRADVAEAYAAKHKSAIAPRTLRRRLEELTVAERVAPVGDASRRVYRPAAAAGPTASEEGYVPLTSAGISVRALVRRPMMEKTPVGYDPDWLFAYEPGKTWYLPVQTRRRLHEVGRTPDADRPAGTFAREIFSRLLIDLAWASSRLEGNTYTRLDTQNLLEFGQRAEGKDAEETQMILNHKAAIELLVDDAEHGVFQRALLLTVHAALAENLLADAADEGRLRERPVSITGTSYTPTAIPQVIRECVDRIVLSVSAIPDPFEAAFFMMVHIPYLQPFVDINKRTSRLAANWPLIRENLCPLSFVEVPERAYVEGTLGVYEHHRVELLRDVFVWAYERSCAQYRVVRGSIAQPDPLRLRYRAELRAVVHDTVKAGEAPGVGTLRERGAALGVNADDLDGFAERALAQLLNLNDGSAARYQLRPSECVSWKASFRRDA
ncbi:MAG: Fic family protein [Gemmatimonadetes bacterium]|nr:Fic family protein [Gemmatimonadota bacterium]